MGPGLDPEQLAAACRGRGIDLVAVASPEGVGPALVARATLGGPSVIVGQEVATAEGPLIGLFLTEDVPAGRSCLATAEAIHAQGGLVMIPDPASVTGAPPPEALRALGASADLHEVRDAEAWAGLRRLGLLPCAGSGATTPDEVGAHVTEMRAAEDPAGLLAALADARSPRAAPAPAARARVLKRRPAGVTENPVNIVPAHDP